MRPSFSVSLEPGLERGIPWGRDLFTFVTSAAGHMMRTLEKPRKSRPSKRQVNHRRFLHNMIQRTKGGKRKRQYAENSPRKFADIEAANHRLSSALYDKDKEKSTPALSEPESPPSERGSQQETDQYSVYTDLEGISESRSGASEEREEKQLDDKHLWTTRPQKSTCTAKMNNHNKMRQTKEKRGKKVTPSSYMNDQNDKDSSEEVELLLSENPNNNQIQMNPVNNISENNQRLPKHPSFILFAPNEYSSPPFSPELSPLSLDSCDFSAQMLSDLSGCTQETITDGLTDVTELYRVSNQDSVGYMDVESYFERMCSCQVEAGSEVCPNEDTMVGNLTDDFTGSENMHEEECICSHENSCEEDRGATADYFQSHLRSSQLPGQSEYPDTKQAYHGMEGTPISQEYSITELQTQEGNSCMLVNSLNLTPFEGVAQSFPVPPLPHHEHRPILTPPHEDDWLFPDIMKDRDPYPYY